MNALDTLQVLNADQVCDLLDEIEPGSPVHLIGIGGCGVSGLAHLLLDLGVPVTGSDLRDNDDVRLLRLRGANIRNVHASEWVGDRQPALVVFTSAVRASNPELVAAEVAGVPQARRATLLAALMRRQRSICVTGMHGKTTTSSLLAYTLERLGACPSFALGGTVPQLPRHSRFSLDGAGEQTPFVAEADESDGTFAIFEPRDAIILNVDPEHLDYFGSFEKVCEAFAEFGAKVEDRLVYCADDPDLVRLYAGRGGAVSYGFNPLADYRIESVAKSPGGNKAFNVFRGETLLGTFSTRLLGEQNVSNAASVVALLCERGFAPVDIVRAMAEFAGVDRRQQLLFANDDWRVYDDYGHHPEEIKVTLACLKELEPKRLLVAFQPHRFTRTRDFLEEFATSFSEADHLWIADVYAASEDAIEGADGASLTRAIAATGRQVEFVADRSQLAARVRAEMRPGDIVLFLGAGDITESAHELARNLKSECVPSEVGGRQEKTQQQEAEKMTAIKEQIFQELARRLSAEAVIREDEPMAKRTTLRVGGPADVYVEPADEEDLSEVLDFCALRRLPFFILGRGSNLLVRDGGVRGVVICLKSPAFSSIEVYQDYVFCAAGARLNQVAIQAKKAELSGLEFFEGIPGCVGGALRMNAGAMGTDTFTILESLRVMKRDGTIVEYRAEEVPHRYRGCDMLRQDIALSAVFRGTPGQREEIENRMAEYSNKRWASQPAVASAGCMFKNPETVAAGKLIDELGLKGLRVGNAVVSDVHGNFLVNEGGATATDVLNLIALVRRKVKEARGIELMTEVQVIGEPLKEGW